MTTITCPICDGTNLQPIVSLKENQSIWVCQNCSNALTIPAPSDVSYDDHSFYELVAMNEERWRSFSTSIVRFIQRSCGVNGRLLDVGCSHGLLLEEARRIGFDVEGIEPSEGAVEYCHRKGLNVRRGYLTKGSYPPNTFDVVVMAHVLEHVSKPWELLDMTRSILTQDGVVCLSQTNYQGTLPSCLGRRWAGWVSHEHYYHFSQAGITWLLEKAGFEVFSVELSPLGYTLDLTFGSPKAIRSTAVSTFQYLVNRCRIGFPFQGDQMYVLARPVS